MLQNDEEAQAVVGALLARGAQESLTKSGKSPKDWALEAGRLIVAEFLRDEVLQPKTDVPAFSKPCAVSPQETVRFQKQLPAYIRFGRFLGPSGANINRIRSEINQAIRPSTFCHLTADNSRTVSLEASDDQTLLTARSILEKNLKNL